MNRVVISIMRFSFFAALAVSSLLRAQAAVGIFEAESEVGSPSRAGKTEFVDGNYIVTGGGSNMWFSADAFHFVWKKVSGDVSLAADISIPTSTGDPHRKGVLIIRQSLDADSPYADAALHGDGLTSLQYRESKGARTYEIQTNVKGPKRLRIEKRGQYVSMSVASEGEKLHPAGGSFRLELREPFYVGLGVCSHNDGRLESAVFSKVELDNQGRPGTNLLSTLETITIASKDRRAIWTTTNRIEAPNWTKENNLIFNSRGHLYSIPAAGGTPTEINTGFAVRCNNDHGLSPDGKTIVISDQTKSDRKSRIYTLPSTGGEPTLITTNAPSYWHGWSPDGSTLAYCAERSGEFDIYTIPVNGGPETRLTTAKGLDDGPDYSPDGKLIYFNSDRTGLMQVWRMKPDGSNQEQVTNDEYNNWFPHPSPDGKWLVILSYEKEVNGHPEDKDVTLRIMPLTGGKLEVLAKLYGGQGTINVPSWSPDSKKLSFVSYQRLP